MEADGRKGMNVVQIVKLAVNENIRSASRISKLDPVLPNQSMNRFECVVVLTPSVLVFLLRLPVHRQSDIILTDCGNDYLP